MLKKVYSLTLMFALLAGMIAGSSLAADGVVVIPLRTEVEVVVDPTPVARTGQTPTVPIAAPTGSDGDLQKGSLWPNPRFTDNGDGTVTDNLTDLTWLANANCLDTVGGIDKSSGTLSWADALTWSNNLANGYCGLTDGSSASDWRLPNKNELNSLIAVAYGYPALSNDVGTGQWTTGADSSFTGVSSEIYWTSTTYALNTGGAWFVSCSEGANYVDDKGKSHFVWAVRD